VFSTRVGDYTSIKLFSSRWTVYEGQESTMMLDALTVSSTNSGTTRSASFWTMRTPDRSIRFNITGRAVLGFNRLGSAEE
jgi:hypothetical protein